MQWPTVQPTPKWASQLIVSNSSQFIAKGHRCGWIGDSPIDSVHPYRDESPIDDLDDNDTNGSRQAGLYSEPLSRFWPTVQIYPKSALTGVEGSRVRTRILV